MVRSLATSLGWCPKLFDTFDHSSNHDVVELRSVLDNLKSKNSEKKTKIRKLKNGSEKEGFDSFKRQLGEKKQSFVLNEIPSELQHDHTRMSLIQEAVEESSDSKKIHRLKEAIESIKKFFRFFS